MSYDVLTSAASVGEAEGVSASAGCGVRSKQQDLTASPELLPQVLYSHAVQDLEQLRFVRPHCTTVKRDRALRPMSTQSHRIGKEKPMWASITYRTLRTNVRLCASVGGSEKKEVARCWSLVGRLELLRHR